MKIRHVLTHAPCLMVLCFLAAGCSSVDGPAKPRRFHEASRANAVLQFSSWDYTFLVQPRYEDNGFLQPLRRENIRQVFDGMQLQRDMAVVVIGWTYGPQETERLVEEWKSLLGDCGFRRVVFVRSYVYNQLNGSQIIDDSTLSMVAAQVRTPTPGTGH